jgi:uncharacterized membrane protein
VVAAAAIVNTPLQWHPMLVHFPLALIITAAATLLLARTLSGSIAATLATVGTWNLGLGAVAALFAVGTGMAAALHLHLAVAAKEAVSLHVKWALFTSVALLLLAVWRGAGGAQNSRPSWLFLLVLFAATGSLIETGYRGGQNVYRFGVGVERAAPSGS